MQPEINSYACTACGNEYTTRDQMTICPRCNSEGGWEEVLILIEKQPANHTEPASQLANVQPLTLDGSELEMMAQAISEFHEAAEQLLITLQPNTPDSIHQQIGLDRAFNLLIKIETEIERRAAIATARLHALRKTA